MLVTPVTQASSLYDKNNQTPYHHTNHKSKPSTTHHAKPQNELSEYASKLTKPVFDELLNKYLPGIGMFINKQ